MASFLSVISSIGHIFGVVTGAEKTVAPLVGAIPVVGPIVNTIFGAITAAEGLITSASQGAVKKSVVTAVVTAQHPGVNESSLSKTIDEVVAAMNALSAALAGAPTT